MYVYTVYDALTGDVVQTLMTEKYRNCVRDVSWNPSQPAELVSSSVSPLHTHVPHVYCKMKFTVEKLPMKPAICLFYHGMHALPVEKA